MSGILAFALPVPGIIAKFQEEQENASIKMQTGDPDRKRLRNLFVKPMNYR